MRIIACGFVMLSAVSQATAGSEAIQANASFSAQIVVAIDDDVKITEQEKNLKRAMYQRSAGECTDILASIATSCSITGISVSTQVNRTYGQPPTIYVNSNVTMQVTLK